MREIVESLATQPGHLLCTVMKVGSTKIGRNVGVIRSKLTLLTGIPATRPAKKLQLNRDIRIQLDLKFDSERLIKQARCRKIADCPAFA